jgi:hypothetical protein
MGATAADVSDAVLNGPRPAAAAGRRRYEGNRFKRIPKATKEEMAKRVEIASYLLARLARPTDVQRYIRAKFFVNERTAREVVRRARLSLLETLQVPLEDHVCNVAAFLSSVVGSPYESTPNKLAAVKMYVELFGLNKPTRVQQVPPAPPAPFTQQQMEEAREEVAGLPPEELCPPPPGVAVDPDYAGPSA